MVGVEASNIDEGHASWEAHNGDWRGRIAAGWDTDGLKALLSEPDWIGGRDGERVFKRDGRSLVVRVDLDAGSVVIKRAFEGTNAKRLKRRLLPSRAIRSWHAAERLARLGIDTPAPVAYIEKRRGPCRGSSLLVVRYVPGADARRYLTDDGVGESERRRVVAQIVGIYARLHAHGIMHGDNRPENFIIHGDRVFLIDLDRSAYVPRWLGVRERYLRRDWRRLVLRWQRYPHIAALFREAMAERGIALPA